MSLCVTALPREPRILIQRSIGDGGFEFAATPEEAGAIYDAINLCLSKGIGKDCGPYEGQPGRGAQALGLEEMFSRQSIIKKRETRVFAEMKRGQFFIRLAMPDRWATLRLRKEEAHNMLAALAEVAGELAARGPAA